MEALRAARARAAAVPGAVPARPLHEPVVLLAPDVRVRGPLDALLGGGPALVPRVLEPAGEAVLAEGLFDSGVLGWGPHGARVLAWWREREEERLREEAGGPHVLDAAPALFEEVAVVRDPAYGVARWNLGTSARRSLDPASARTLALRAAALAAVRATRPRFATARQRRRGRRGAARRPAATPPRDGIELADLDTRGEGTHRLLEWANGPADRGAVQGVTRYLRALHGRRLDLHDTFRALEDDDGEAFVHWARTTGRADGIPDVLLPLPAPESAPAAGEPPAAGRQRRGLPADRARRRRGGAALRRRARGRAGAGAHRDRRPRPAQAQAHGLRGPPPRGRVPVQPRLRQRVRAARLRAPHRRRLLRGPRHDRQLGVGGLDGPRLLGRGVHARRRDLDLLGLRHERARGRLAGPGRHAPAARAAAAGRRPARGPRARRRVHVPVHVRLLLDRAAQEPGRARARPTRAPSARTTARSS